MSSAVQLLPLPYHEALVDYLRTQETECWNWFSSTQAQSRHADDVRLDLLKNAFRLEPGAHPDLAAAVAEAAAVLAPGAQVTVYQSPQGRGLNATVIPLPGEAHIVFDGSVLDLLSPAELRGLLGHELAHYRLWQEDGGKFLIADRIAHAAAQETRAEPSHVETARLLRLYTEIYADRGALCVTRDPVPVIAGLIKMQTGLSQVDPAGYIRQADEVLARAKIRTEELTHPEMYIRTRAIGLWAENPAAAEAEVGRMIEGAPTTEKLDLLGQKRFAALSRRWLQLLLQPEWFRTDPVLGHARMFFPDFAFSAGRPADDALIGELRGSPLAVRDYFCYLLLDFASIDPELEDEPLKAAHVLAARCGWDDRLEALSVKELKLKKRDAKRLHDEALANGATVPEAPA